MRVYGSSPLYNYVELVFRSRRLFIAAILISTVVVVVMAMRKAKFYNAEALVLLSGQQATGTADPSAAGTIKFKLNLLNFYTQNPNFWKDAMEPLHGNMNTEQYEEFCREVRGAVSFATGENFLRISCRWKDRRAADILNHFYDEYSRRVLQQETAVSTKQTQMLRETLEEYRNKEKALDRMVTNYQVTHKGRGAPDIAADIANADQQRQKVRTIQVYLAQAQREYKATLAELQNTPKEIPYYRDTTTDTSTWDGRFAQAQENLDEARELMKAVEGKGRTENHPEYKAAAKKLEDATVTLAKIEKQRPKGADAKKAGPERTGRNPAWAALDKQRSALTIYIQGTTATLSQEQQTLAKLEKQAENAPNEQFRYKWMTTKYGMYNGIRTNLEEAVEQAQMQEKRERELRIAEMKMEVEPRSELENVGAKSMIFYAAGPLLGIVIAFAFSLFVETMDHSLRTPIEVEKYLNKPVLAVLPKVATGRKAARQIAGETRTSLTS